MTGFNNLLLVNGVVEIEHPDLKMLEKVAEVYRKTGFKNVEVKSTRLFGVKDMVHQIMTEGHAVGYVQALDLVLEQGK